MAASPVGPINTIATMSAVDWDDRIGLQSKWSNPDKGWKIDVEWRTTEYGAGVFTVQDVPQGTIIRKGTNGLNLLQFHSSEDIHRFVHGGDQVSVHSRIAYISDYLYGFDPNAAAGEPADEQLPWFFGVWIPGHGLNHSPDANTVYLTAEGAAAGGLQDIDLVTLKDVPSGTMLTDDYRRHGTAPQWALEFAAANGVSLNFAGCNDFVVSD